MLVVWAVLAVQAGVVVAAAGRTPLVPVTAGQVAAAAVGCKCRSTW